MFKPSVTTKPKKPSFSSNKLVTTFLDSEEGNLSLGSILGTLK